MPHNSRISRLEALYALDPKAPRQPILDAVDAAKGQREAAATALGVSPRTLYRWIGKLKLWGAIDSLCDRRGYPRIPGPPRGQRSE